MLNFLRRNLYRCNQEVKSMEYASCVWDPYFDKDIYALEMVQRRVAHDGLHPIMTKEVE